MQSIGRRVPFFEFQKIAKRLFTDYSLELHKKVIHIFINIPISEKDIDLELEKLKSPSATWTYIINDNPLELALGEVGGIGLLTASGATAPIIMLFRWIRSCFLKLRLNLK